MRLLKLIWRLVDWPISWIARELSCNHLKWKCIDIAFDGESTLECEQCNKRRKVSL